MSGVLICLYFFLEDGSPRLQLRHWLARMNVAGPSCLRASVGWSNPLANGNRRRRRRFDLHHQWHVASGCPSIGLDRSDRPEHLRDGAAHRRIGRASAWQVAVEILRIYRTALPPSRPVRRIVCYVSAGRDRLEASTVAVRSPVPIPRCVAGDRFACSGLPAAPRGSLGGPMERIVVTSPSRHRRAALLWAPNQAREQFDDEKFHDKGNPDSRCRIVADDGSRDGDGTKGDAGGVSSKAVTGTQTGSQQTNNPATGTALGATSTQTAPTYPATVGPTGSTQPDATNSVRSSPAGGGKN